MNACLLVVAGSRSCCGAVQLRYGVEAGSRFLHPTHFQAHHRHVWYTDELGSVEFIHYAPLVFQQAIDHPATHTRKAARTEAHAHARTHPCRPHRIASHGMGLRRSVGWCQLRKLFNCSDDEYLEALASLKDKGCGIACLLAQYTARSK